MRAGVAGPFRSLPMEGLGERDAIELLHGLGVAESDAYRVNRFARGHPLSLRLAASALHERPDLDLEEGTLDEESHEFVAEGRRFALSPREFEVLRYLWDREGKVVSRADLLDDVWEPDYDGGSNVVDVVMRGLRHKLGDHAGMIETLRGSGYRFRHA